MPKIPFPCAQCSKIVYRWPSQAIKSPAKWGPFCDRNCLGLFRTDRLVGSLAANFKSGSQKSRGYFTVLAPWHPSHYKTGRVSLHRVIAEARLGRYLSEDEIVHHKDHNPENNHWDNLEVMTQAEHARLHREEENVA